MGSKWVKWVGGSQVFCLPPRAESPPNSIDFEGDFGKPPIPLPGTLCFLTNFPLKAQNSLTHVRPGEHSTKNQTLSL